MAWRRLPVFRSDMGRRSAVVSLIVAMPDGRANESPNCLSVRDEGPGRVRAEIQEGHITGLRRVRVDNRARDFARHCNLPGIGAARRRLKRH
jgi:hypothetical protein